MFPRVIINTEKYRHNLRYLLDISHKFGIKVMAVSKVFCADQHLVQIMIDENVDYIADSRLLNLASINTTIPKVLLRLPSHGEIDQVVKNCDISLNSELSTIKLLNQYALKSNTKHGVIIMIDLGDLREGIFEETEVFNMIENVLELSNIDLKGIGVNLTCYGGVLPTPEVFSKLVEYKRTIEDKYSISLEIVSGGNSSSIDLLFKGLIPKEINNLRLGESLILGRETAFGDYIDNTYDDVITLEADIIELKLKPSLPIGQIGMNAFGKVPTFKDEGNRFRAILAIGKQDVDYNELIPFDTIKLIGSSSDHLIVDVTNSINKYEIGDTMLFKLTYSSVLSLMTSKYVRKTYE